MTAQTVRNRRTADGTMMALGSGWGCPKPTRRGRSWKIGQTHGLGARFRQPSSSIAGMVHASKAELPRLSAAHWPTGAYRREDLPERVLQFGTGMLLRALCATFVDAANTAGTFSGRSVVIQSTLHGQARALNAQDGLFTLVERGLEHGAPVERTRLLGAISRALIADAEIAPVSRVRSPGAPCSSPRSTSVNRPSWALRADACPCGVLCTTTMRPPKAPATFAASTEAAHTARS